MRSETPARNTSSRNNPATSVIAIPSATASDGSGISFRIRGIYSRADLRALGVGEWRQIGKLLNEERLTRISRGWYASPEADPDIVALFRNGLRPGCVTVCQLHGLWVPPGSGLHAIYRDRQTSDIKQLQSSRSDVVLHRVSSFPKGQLISLAEALAHVVECCDSETALIILESAVNHRMISLAQAQEISEQGKKGNRGIAKHLRAGAQSGSESRVRYFFQKNQVIVENQVLINEVGWVDLLVGEKLIIEFDSDAHHSARIDYLNDRNRDKAAIAAGYLVVRLSYPQIWYEWEETQEFLMELVRKNKHREKSASERGVGA